MKVEQLYGVAVGCVTTLIGGWDLTLQVMAILIGVDVITGVLKGLQQGKYSSKTFRQGIVTKAGFIVVLILCYQVDVLMNNPQPLVRTACAIFYIGVEGSSIIENLGLMGVPIPETIKKKFIQLQEQEKAEEPENKESEAVI